LLQKKILKPKSQLHSPHEGFAALSILIELQRGDHAVQRYLPPRCLNGSFTFGWTNAYCSFRESHLPSSCDSKGYLSTQPANPKRLRRPRTASRAAIWAWRCGATGYGAWRFKRVDRKNYNFASTGDPWCHGVASAWNASSLHSGVPNRRFERSEHSLWMTYLFKDFPMNLTLTLIAGQFGRALSWGTSESFGTATWLENIVLKTLGYPLAFLGKTWLKSVVLKERLTVPEYLLYYPV
jgi:hypothetical protein